MTIEYAGGHRADDMRRNSPFPARWGRPPSGDIETRAEWIRGKIAEDRRRAMHERMVQIGRDQAADFLRELDEEERAQRRVAELRRIGEARRYRG